MLNSVLDFDNIISNLSFRMYLLLIKALHHMQLTMSRGCPALLSINVNVLNCMLLHYPIIRIYIIWSFYFQATLQHWFSVIHSVHTHLWYDSPESCAKSSYTFAMPVLIKSPTEIIGVFIPSIINMRIKALTVMPLDLAWFFCLVSCLGL